MKKYLFIAMVFLLGASFAMPAFAQDAVNLLNPLAGFTANYNDDPVESFQGLAGNLVAQLILILTALSLLPIVVGGIYMTASSGNEDMVKRGKSSVVWGVIGLLLGLSSYVIYNFVLQVVIQ